MIFHLKRRQDGPWVNLDFPAQMIEVPKHDFGLLLAKVEHFELDGIPFDLFEGEILIARAIA